MGVLVPIVRRGEYFDVEIPNEILPEEFYTERTEVKHITDEVPAITFVYAGRGPRPEEGLFEAIRAAREVRYGVGVTFSVREVMRRGYPSELRLVRICYPPIPYIRGEMVCVDVKERPRITLRPRMVRGEVTDWRARIPIDIIRKYALYAFPRGHPYFMYNPILYFEWTSLRTIRIPPRQPDVYHIGKYYKPEWRLGKWIWRIPENIECYEPIKTGFELGAAPSAQCFFEDDTVYIDIIFSPWGGKVVARHLGYAYRNMVVRSYTLRDEFSSYKTEECDIEIRSTFVTPCPIEFYQSNEKHMKLCAKPPERSALDITTWNILVYFGRQALVKGYYYSPLAEMAKSEKMKEVVGREINVKVSFAEVKDDRFFYVNKYVRIDKKSRGKSKRYVYTTEFIDRRIVEGGGIVDEKGFVWRGP